MSLDTINLSAFLRQLLFNDNLVEAERKEDIPEAPMVHAADFLGENLQQTVFLVHQADARFLPDEQMKLLTKLISACGLTMDDIALVNCHRERNNYLQFTDQFRATKMLLFGVAAEEIGLPFTLPLFQIRQFDELFYLSAPSLGELIHNVNLKAPLWACLKQLFLKK